MTQSLLGQQKLAQRNVDENVVTVSGAPCTLQGIQVCNAQAAAAFIQLFDATGDVTPGTTNPDLEFSVAANASQAFDLGKRGIDFVSGLKMISTTAERGAVGSADGVIVFLQWE